MSWENGRDCVAKQKECYATDGCLGCLPILVAAPLILHGAYYSYTVSPIAVVLVSVGLNFFVVRVLRALRFRNNRSWVRLYQDVAERYAGKEDNLRQEATARFKHADDLHHQRAYFGLVTQTVLGAAAFSVIDNSIFPWLSIFGLSLTYAWMTAQWIIGERVRFAQCIIRNSPFENAYIESVTDRIPSGSDVVNWIIPFLFAVMWTTAILGYWFEIWKATAT